MGSTSFHGGAISLHADANYLVSNTLFSSFVVGNVGAADDFFLVGATPHPGTDYPLLTGNILDSEGNTLFRIVQNVLVVNPKNCSKILGNHIGYEIHDGNDQLIFKVSTTFEYVDRVKREMYVTRISGKFYDRNKRIVFLAGEEELDSVISTTKGAFGMSSNGSFFTVSDMDDTEIRLAQIALESRGKIHEPVRGIVSNRKLLLDGKVLIDATFLNCEVEVRTGDFASVGEVKFENCVFDLHDSAKQIAILVKSLDSTK